MELRLALGSPESEASPQEEHHTMARANRVPGGLAPGTSYEWPSAASPRRPKGKQTKESRDEVELHINLLDLQNRFLAVV
jgi:hypothetical protein